ncbi:MAG: hypothetical protein D3922_15750 [Candidatus Electrothrix sp. AR1]|nr:hypothetical protein [Candidatus Electrothrix sp. AR1]
MKIIRPSSRELILRDGCGPVGILIGFLIMGCVAFAVYKYFINDLGTICFSCERIEPKLVNCQVTRTPFFHLGPTVTERYDSVLDASNMAEKIVFINDDNKGEDMSMYRHYVVLQTGYDKTLLYIHWGRRSEQARKIVIKLNRFLQSKRQSITFIEPVEFETSFKRCLSTFFLLSGVVAVNFLLMNTTTLNIDKCHNKISRRTVTIFGFRAETSELQELQAVAVEEYRGSDCNVYFALVITMLSGKKYRLGGTRDQKYVVDNANQVREFLDLSPLPLPAVFST